MRFLLCLDRAVSLFPSSAEKGSRVYVLFIKKRISNIPRLRRGGIRFDGDAADRVSVSVEISRKARRAHGAHRSVARVDAQIDIAGELGGDGGVIVELIREPEKIAY